MSNFHRSGHWRTNAYGTTFWVNGHDVSRDDFSGHVGGFGNASHYDSYGNSYNIGFYNKSRVGYNEFIGAFINPNASCPVCGAPVFFYQSENGGRVFFDELGPPWPKHPCTDSAQSSFKKISISLSGIDGYFIESKISRLSWHKTGWRPLSISKANIVYGNFTEIQGVLEDIDISIYIKNFDIDVDLIKILPVHLMYIDEGRFELSTIGPDFKEYKYMFFRNLNLANQEAKNTSEKCIFQLNPTKVQKRHLAGLFGEPEQVITLMEKENYIPSSYDDIGLFMLKHKNTLSVSYNKDMLIDIIYRYVNFKKLSYDFFDNCSLYKDNFFYFPLSELHRVEPLHHKIVKRWRSSLNGRRYVPAFLIVKSGSDYYVEIELEALTNANLKKVLR